MEMDLILGIVIGAVIGVGLSFLLKKGGASASSVKELKEEHDKYRKQVDDHFVNSAVLLKGLTEQYRDVYRHIATGAGELCTEEAKALQIEMEETALLAQPEAADVVADQVKPEEESAPITESEVKESDVKAEVTEEAKISEAASAEDGIPLASEVEISAEVTEEIKNQADKKA